MQTCGSWLAGIALVLGTAVSGLGKPPPPLSPEESLRAIRVPSGLKVELVAAEPLVQDPIAIAWGPDGRLWVVEMGDYPLGVDGAGGAGGRIKILSDSDGDGRYDQATLFLDKLAFPTGVLPWRNGALVTCAPDLFFAADTNHDGYADQREVLFSGFPQRNQQHRVNGLQWGLDHWVYCANGDGGVGGETRIDCRKTGVKIDLGGRDFRFRPDTGVLEPQTGTTQFGRNRDDWGNWFGSNNAQPLYHFVLADEYLRRNPQIVPPDPRRHLLHVPGPYFALAAGIPIHGEAAARGPGPYRVGLGGPCSGMIYRDTFLGSQFYGNAFVCDPVTSLVHRTVLEPDGVTFRSHRPAAEQHREFFASQDNWTRPTMIRTGPDGSLWVVDMYRLVIEHPQWIAAQAKQELDLRAGHNLGRIYRIVPEGKRPSPLPRLDHMDTAGLVSSLDSPHGWQRDMAQQLLLWKAPADASPLLLKLWDSTTTTQVRLQTLYTLEGLGKLSRETIRAALCDPHSEIRRHAIKLAEPWLREGTFPPQVLKTLRSEATPHVRLQLAYSLGEWRSNAAIGELAALGLDGQDDAFLNAAVLSSLSAGNAGKFLGELLQRQEHARFPVQLLAQAVSLATTAGDSEIERRIQAAFRPVAGRYRTWQVMAGAAWFTANESRVGTRAVPVPVFAEPLLEVALTLSLDSAAELPQRLAAVNLLGRLSRHQERDIAGLVALIAPRHPSPVQLAAVERLISLEHASALPRLLHGWPGYGPLVRGRILDALLSREATTRALLARLETGEINPADIDAVRRQRLRDHPQAAIRAATQKIFVAPTSSERNSLIGNYRQALRTPGSVARGKQVFEKRCAVCHRLGDNGQAVGPNLTAFVRKPGEEWLIAILDPNRAVEPRYASYVAHTAAGHTVTGLIVSETATSLTFLGADGRSQTLLRSDIDELRNTGKSLMPEGLDRDLSASDIADLLAFAKSQAP